MLDACYLYSRSTECYAMMPGPCPFIDVSVDDVMLACLAHIHFSSAVHTVDYFPFS